MFNTLNFPLPVFLQPLRRLIFAMFWRQGDVFYTWMKNNNNFSHYNFEVGNKCNISCFIELDIM